MYSHRSENCSSCGAKMIEDVWENIIVHSDGTIHQELIVPAWVCSQFCGYYEEVRE